MVARMRESGVIRVDSSAILAGIGNPGAMLRLRYGQLSTLTSGAESCSLRFPS